MVHRAGLLYLIGDEGVLLVEEEKILLNQRMYGS